ncbi:hypothetical protein [Glycomyces sp. YM15]|uniref:hypothetical protein n=1 Tax=Glycomyces sp. YM15 TaxID=2800446 RepID=UPI0019666490|nr:hypothetical protein [Glycomyces sp. YM15]
MDVVRPERVRALWEIIWYNSDWPLKVGERDVFPFLRGDAGRKPGYDLCFGHDLMCDNDYRWATVEAVEHPKFGAIDEVDTGEFGEYTFRFRDGRWVAIDTEQSHGVVLASSPDFTIDKSDPDWDTYMGSWDRHSGWDLDVTLTDLVVSNHAEMRAHLDALRAQGR